MTKNTRPFAMEADTGWVAKPPGINRLQIVDYERIVTFPEGTTENQMKQAFDWIKTHDNPGWANFSYQLLSAPYQWILFTTYDSSG